MAAPEEAFVRPRVKAPDSGGDILLEDYVAILLDRGKPFCLDVVGPAGAGKSMAVQYLASLPIADHLTILDDGRSLRQAHPEFIVRARARSASEPNVQLSPWTEDDLLEYALAAGVESIGEVLTDCERLNLIASVQGNPEICRLVVNRLASIFDRGDRSRSMPTLGFLFRQLAADACINHAHYEELRRYFFDLHFTDEEVFYPEDSPLPRRSLSQNPAILEAILAEELGQRYMQLRVKPSDDLMISDSQFGELRNYICEDPSRIESFRNLDRCRPSRNVASVLHAIDGNWTPAVSSALSRLAGARLPGLRWIGNNVRHLVCNDADLSGSEFTDTKLELGCLRSANLRGADFSGGKLSQNAFDASDLTSAILCRAVIDDCSFHSVDFSNADLSLTIIEDSVFDRAVLSGSQFANAKVHRTTFCEAKLGSCDFADAVFVSCDFRGGVDFRSAKLSKAKFSMCQMASANLESCVVEDCGLQACKLDGAFLTDSIMRRVNLTDADLRVAGLAGINWEGCDLRNANLQNCSFHLGSTRCGTVDSPYPSHGTRTGYYTNDYDDRSLRRPEEIRKANLCGTDLRGANVYGTDFYLVDLRGARYDSEQEAHFRRCDAILD